LADITEDGVAAELDDLVHSIEGLSKITDKTQIESKSYSLLGTFFGIVGKMNYLIHNELGEGRRELRFGKAITASLLDSLDQWILKIKHAFSQLAKYLDALSYAIGFSVPLGLDVSMTFAV
jgi:hypothetical protein